jgi:hypothetical protein
MYQRTTFQHTFRFILAAATVVGLTALAACAGHTERTSPGTWSAGTVRPVAPDMGRAAPIAPPLSSPSASMAPAPRLTTPQRGSVTAGCDGTFTRLGAGGTIAAEGRAHNTGAGLVRLDARGNRGAAIAAASNGESLLFRPDCSCQSVRQVSEAGGVAPMCQAS